jgi:hypothetical protein
LFIPVTTQGKFNAGLAEDLSMFNLNEAGGQIPIHEHRFSIGSDRISTHPHAATLVDVTAKLARARRQAEGLNDKLFLYLIDTAIFHAHEVLDKQTELGEHEKWS